MVYLLTEYECKLTYWIVVDFMICLNESLCVGQFAKKSRSFVHLFVRSFVRSFVRLFVLSFLRLFLRLFLRFFLPSFTLLVAVNHGSQSLSQTRLLPCSRSNESRMHSPQPSRSDSASPSFSFSNESRLCNGAKGHQSIQH